MKNNKEVNLNPATEKNIEIITKVVQKQDKNSYVQNTLQSNDVSMSKWFSDTCKLLSNFLPTVSPATFAVSYFAKTMLLFEEKANECSAATTAIRKSVYDKSMREEYNQSAGKSLVELNERRNLLSNEFTSLANHNHSIIQKRNAAADKMEQQLGTKIDKTLIPFTDKTLASAYGKSDEELIEPVLEIAGKLSGVEKLLQDISAEKLLSEQIERESASVIHKERERVVEKPHAAAVSKVAEKQPVASDTQAALRGSFDKFFDDLIAEIKTGFADLKEVFSTSAVAAPDPETEYNQQVQTITKDLTLALENLQNQYENNNLTVESYRSNLELLKEVYAGYPEILAIVEEHESRLNDAQSNSISRTKALIENLEEASSAAQKQVDDLASNTLIGLSDGLASAIVNGENLGNTLKKLGDNILYVVVRAMMLKMVSSLVSSLFGGFGGSSAPAPVTSGININNLGMGTPLCAKGNVFGPQGLKAFAKGGVVSQPTLFGFAKGIGLMGEAGAEAIMPLGRDSRGNLGVRVADGAMSGASSAGSVFAPHVEINVENKGGGDMSEEQARTLGSQVKAIVEMQVAKQMYEYMRNGMLRPSMGRGY